jgi:hypothetical protein
MAPLIFVLCSIDINTFLPTFNGGLFFGEKNRDHSNALIRPHFNQASPGT